MLCFVGTLWYVCTLTVDCNAVFCWYIVIRVFIDSGLPCCVLLVHCDSVYIDSGLQCCVLLVHCDSVYIDSGLLSCVLLVHCDTCVHWQWTAELCFVGTLWYVCTSVMPCYTGAGDVCCWCCSPAVIAYRQWLSPCCHGLQVAVWHVLSWGNCWPVMSMHISD